MLFVVIVIVLEIDSYFQNEIEPLLYPFYPFITLFGVVPKVNIILYILSIVSLCLLNKPLDRDSTHCIIGYASFLTSSEY